MRRIAFLLFLLVVGAMPILPVGQAAALDLFGGQCQAGQAGANSAACSGSGDDNISGTNGIILRVAAALSIIASIAAIIVILIAAIMFITAGGDSSRVSSARNMIIYSIVGLIVIFLARTIVAFVVTNV